MAAASSTAADAAAKVEALWAPASATTSSLRLALSNVEVALTLLRERGRYFVAAECAGLLRAAPPEDDNGRDAYTTLTRGRRGGRSRRSRQRGQRRRRLSPGGEPRGAWARSAALDAVAGGGSADGDALALAGAAAACVRRLLAPPTRAAFSLLRLAPGGARRRVARAPAPA
ncbi:hypothetical protein JL721_4320 [Aureococcus anophagefferens]|nr:hypothetical protein JL721_4320 [Aureococcus anophagefferens]